MVRDPFRWQANNDAEIRGESVLILTVSRNGYKQLLQLHREGKIKILHQVLEKRTIKVGRIETEEFFYKIVFEPLIELGGVLDEIESVEEMQISRQNLSGGRDDRVDEGDGKRVSVKNQAASKGKKGYDNK